MPLPPDVFRSLPPAVRETIETSGARIRIGFPFWLRPFLWSGVAAITLGRRVYFASTVVGRRDVFVATLRHELVHVRQVARVGLLRFAFIYLRDYLRNRRAGLDRFRAYAAIPFEIEARQAEREETGELPMPEELPLRL